MQCLLFASDNLFNYGTGINTSLKVTDLFAWGSSTIFCKLAATEITHTHKENGQILGQAREKHPKLIRPLSITQQT